MGKKTHHISRSAPRAKDPDCRIKGCKRKRLKDKNFCSYHLLIETRRASMPKSAD